MGKYTICSWPKSSKMLMYTLLNAGVYWFAVYRAVFPFDVGEVEVTTQEIYGIRMLLVVWKQAITISAADCIVT